MASKKGRKSTGKHVHSRAMSPMLVRLRNSSDIFSSLSLLAPHFAC